jgi:ABC-type multidrug transport system permease subunit
MKKQTNLTKTYWINFLKLKRNELLGVVVLGLTTLPGIFFRLKMFNWFYIMLGIMFISINLYLAYIKTYISDNGCTRINWYGMFCVMLIIIFFVNFGIIMVK